MAIAIQKRSARTRVGRSRGRTAFVGGMFVALLAAAWVVGHGIFADAPKAAPTSQYRGIVQFAPDRRGECEQFEFDNQTGVLQLRTHTWCGATTGAVPPSTELNGQLTGVREYFKPH